MLNYDARGCPKHFNPTTRTMEERRAAITCFLLGSTYEYPISLFLDDRLIQARNSSYFQRLEPPRWTVYLENCLQMLAENKECPTDILLAILVRLQLITERIAQAPWNDGSTESLTPRAPATFYLKALETQLQDCKQTIPPEFQQNGKSLPFPLHNRTLILQKQKPSFSTSTTPSSPSTRSPSRTPLL
jgi:hypothetical protein